jgi:hypothetical protein
MLFMSTNIRGKYEINTAAIAGILTKIDDI